jgi:hypothetical protein
MLVDIYARQRRRSSEYVLQTFYGQLQHLFTIHFNTICPELDLDAPTTIILAAIRTCVLDDDESALNGLDIHRYSKDGVLHFLDIKNVQCLVGCVRDGNRWAIVDRSDTLARALYKNDDD